MDLHTVYHSCVLDLKQTCMCVLLMSIAQYVLFTCSVATYLYEYEYYTSTFQ